MDEVSNERSLWGGYPVRPRGVLFLWVSLLEFMHSHGMVGGTGRWWRGWMGAMERDRVQWREIEEPDQNEAEWMFLVHRGRIEAGRMTLMHMERTMMPKISWRLKWSVGRVYQVENEVSSIRRLLLTPQEPEMTRSNTIVVQRDLCNLLVPNISSSTWVSSCVWWVGSSTSV